MNKLKGNKTELKTSLYSFNKTHICKLCGWKGRTHLHHIIPIKDNGEDTSKNIIELCPNHHSESYDNEVEFAKKFKLKGQSFSKDKVDNLIKGSILYYKLNLGVINKKENGELNEIILLYGFDKYDFVSYSLGITRNSLIDLELNFNEKDEQ